MVDLPASVLPRFDLRRDAEWRIRSCCVCCVRVRGRAVLPAIVRVEEECDASADVGGLLQANSAI